MEQLENTLNIIWVAYNEEKTLPKSVESVTRAIEYTKKFYNINFRGVICHNGCTDNTPKVAQEIKAKAINSKFPIEVISSNKGMVIAQNTSINYICKQGFENQPVLFIDADCLMNENVIKLIYEQYEKHPEIIAVGTHPIPLSIKIKNPYKKLKHEILNFRAYHPQTQISNLPESYHPYADSDPMPIGSTFEKKSKTYFHGRCFSLRRATIWDVPNKTIGEDTYLHCSITKKYGPGSIRVLYHANIYFNPIDSITKYLNTYARIYIDKEHLKTSNQDFKKILEESSTLLDSSYVKTLTIKEQAAFYLYRALEKSSSYLFKKKFWTKKNIEDLWKYDTKKEVKI